MDSLREMQSMLPPARRISSSSFPKVYASSQLGSPKSSPRNSSLQNIKEAYWHKVTFVKKMHMLAQMLYSSPNLKPRFELKVEECLYSHGNGIFKVKYKKNMKNKIIDASLFLYAGEASIIDKRRKLYNNERPSNIREK